MQMMESSELAKDPSKHDNIFDATFFSLTNFKIQRYHQNKPQFNSVYSRNNLPKHEDGTHLISLDE